MPAPPRRRWPFTGSKLNERALRTHQLEQADRLKTAILRAVSHDLRTPITVIKTRHSNLRQLLQQLSPDQQLEIAATIENEADILNDLVGNLLDLSRLQAGAVQLNRAANSLEELAGDAAARVWQRTGQERVRLVFPEDLPLVEFDYGLALQALSNLVENALRYEASDSAIELRGEFGGDEARLAVINHGPNLTPEERAPDQRAVLPRQAGQDRPGPGDRQGIVEAHHGRLQIDDTPGGGVTFVIVLPFNRKEEAQHEAENPGGG
jgi:two-component system sensor histidine kinase KdpD